MTHQLHPLPSLLVCSHCLCYIHCPIGHSIGGPIGRAYTVSVALPGSIIHNAQTAELRTYLAGQIARALVVFNVDEVVVFDEDSGRSVKRSQGQSPNVTCINSSCGQSKSLNNPNAFLGRILHYLETPQYLRKSLFPMHSDLRYVGTFSVLHTHGM